MNDHGLEERKSRSGDRHHRRCKASGVGLFNACDPIASAIVARSTEVLDALETAPRKYRIPCLFFAVSSGGLIPNSSTSCLLDEIKFVDSDPHHFLKLRWSYHERYPWLCLMMRVRVSRRKGERPTRRALEVLATLGNSADSEDE